MKIAKTEAHYDSHHGSDLLVVNAARSSFGKWKSEFEPEKDVGLIEFLATGMRSSEWDAFLAEIVELGARAWWAASTPAQPGLAAAKSDLKQRLLKFKRQAQHWAPFGHPHVTLRLRMPIFLARQFVKHCVTGDTEVTFVKKVKGGSNGVSRRTIKHLYDMWSGAIKYQGGAKGRWNVSVGNVRVFNESTLRFETSHICDVIHQGCKQVFKVTVESGQTLRATGNHEVMTQRGWVRVDELTTEDFMVTETGFGQLIRGDKPPRWNDWEDKQARRSVVKDACAKCGSTDDLEADHIVPVLFGGSHDASNMQCLCHSCHVEKTSVERFLGQPVRNEYDPRYVRVMSVCSDGEEDVYDITVEGTHNFLANGLVVHNCVGAVWSEESRRYIDDEPEFYFDPVWMSRPDDIKQGAAGEVADPEVVDYLMKLGTQKNLETYMHLVNRESGHKMAPEQAREILTLNMMTGVTWTGSLLFWSRVCNQRLDSHAQSAAQTLAKQISDIVGPLFPVSWKALTGVDTGV